MAADDVAPRAARSCSLQVVARVGEGGGGGPGLFFPFILRGFIPPFNKRERPDRHAVAFVRLHAPLIRTAPTHILSSSSPLPLSLCTPPLRVGFRPAVVHLAEAAMTAADGEACAVVATAADIICSLRGADLAGWTPPWRKHEPACDGGKEEGDGGGDLAWPAVARGKRSRSSRRESPSASGSAASADAKEKKKARRGARGSPASPLDYSGGSGSGSGASTSGGEDGAFCSQPQPEPAFPPAAACQQLAAPAAPPPPPPSKVGGVAGRRTILPVPPPRPAGQRARKMRLPEIQQMVRLLSVENDALRKEMKALQRACTALSQENGKLETRLDQSITLNEVIFVENKGKKPQPEHQRTAEQEAPTGFVLPDLNLPADD